MMKFLMNQSYKWLWLVIASCGTLLLAGTAYAADDIGDVAFNLNQAMAPLYTLMVAISLVSGVGFAIAAVFKFKQHKDNPTQIPIGTPIALVFIAAALIFLPSVVKVFGESMFSRLSDTSKICFAHLVHFLKSQGFALIDCQVYSEHLARLGARAIPRNEFSNALNQFCDSINMQPWPTKSVFITI